MVARHARAAVDDDDAAGPVFLCSDRRLAARSGRGDRRRRSDPPAPSRPTELVGRRRAQVTPVNQTLTPRGTFVDLPGLRPQVLARRATAAALHRGKTSELLVLDADSGEHAPARAAAGNDAA
jgi:hypothetical protein